MSDRDHLLIPEKKSLHEELHLPASTAEIRAEVQSGELDPFEIEKLVLNPDTTIDTHEALAKKDAGGPVLGDAVLPPTTMIAADLKLQLRMKQRAPLKKRLVKKRAAEQAHNYKLLLLPNPRTKTLAEKRDAKKIKRIKRRYRLSEYSGRKKGYR